MGVAQKKKLARQLLDRMQKLEARLSHIPSEKQLHKNYEAEIEDIKERIVNLIG